jgi:membrane associated rhomboid family serine protease
MRPEDPMRTRATDSGVEDGWRGARIGAEARDRERRELARIDAEVDVGEPEVPRVIVGFLLLALVVTVVEFATWGTSPTPSELSRAGGAGIGVVATGAWWKLLVSNLLHANVPHLLMNVFVTYLTGRWLEHLVGHAIVVATICWSAVLAGIGSLLVDTPTVAIGASGVAFGVIGCALGVDPRARTAVGVIARQLAVVNVIITFLIPGISIGGHFGGLLAGVLVGLIAWDRRPGPGSPVGRPRPVRAIALTGLALAPIAVLAIGPRALPGQAVDARAGVAAWLLERQLSGAELTSGRSIDEASCTATRDVLAYDCELDGDPARVRFDPRDDQWSLSPR